jgi:3-deoxy-7-phosphoheptulonate synthase
VTAPPDWKPSSWSARPIRQQPRYDDPAELERVLARIRRLPPLVAFGEVENFRHQVAEAAAGRRFVLQGGDCAERFQDCDSQSIIRKLKILLQMSLVLTYGARRPVVRVGRIAGQFAKPRSADTERVNGVELPVYRGDNVNDLAPDPVLRRPDPNRLELGYFNAAATLNFVRALVEGGFASLRDPEHWQLDFIPEGMDPTGYREIAARIHDAIDYLDSLGAMSQTLRKIDFFTSHEGLLLPYEEALTRRAEDGRWYNLGAHFLWLGERTRDLDGAHVEYFRGLANPIGVKIGPSTKPEDLARMVDILDPDREPGRLMLITRFGAKMIGELLPALLRAVQSGGHSVVWSCDPMHGNTTTVDGTKTRHFDEIVGELRAAFEIHKSENSHLAGVHIELTGDNVTECIGGVEGLKSADLSRCYETGCDPRLNYAQSLEIAFLISRMLTDTARDAQRPLRG